MRSRLGNHYPNCPSSDYPSDTDAMDGVSKDHSDCRLRKRIRINAMEVVQTENVGWRQQSQSARHCPCYRSKGWAWWAIVMSESNRTRYHAIAASLRTEDIVEADRIADALSDEGWPHSTRSLVIREALSCLSDALRGMTSEEIFRYFLDRRGRRIPRKPSNAA